MPATALVLDGSLQSALAVTRSLAKHGVRVICGAERRTALTLHARYCAERFVYRSPIQDLEGFMQDLEVFLRRQPEPVVVYCLSDLTFLPLARNRERFSSLIRMSLSSSESTEIVFDKQLTCLLAHRLDIPIPATETVDSAAYPLIMKPRHSCIWKNNRGVWGKVEIVMSVNQAKETFDQMSRRYGESPLIQEYIRGPEYGIFFYAIDGQVRATFAHHRLRSFDPSGGASVLRESIDPPPDMLAYSQHLIQELHWNGPVMVEWKRDVRDGRPILMEINGRLWGSLPLAISSGVDFPWLMYLHATGQNISPTTAYIRGHRSRQLLGDVRNLVARLISGPATPETASRWKVLKEFCHFRDASLSYDVESWDDWKPAVWQIIDQVWKRLHAKM